MSTSDESHAGNRTVDAEPDGAIGPGTFRLLALGCVLVLTASYVSVLREVTRVVGGTETLFTIVVAMLVAATILAWAIRPRTATVGAIVAVVFGFAYYLEISGVGVGTVLSASDSLLSDTLEIVTGLPLLRMVAADVWTFAFVPGPVFLSWYLAVRGRYALGVVPGGLALFVLVLTGDAGTTITLLGTLAALGAVGFGELERRGGSVAQADLLAVLFAAIIVLSLSVTFVPTGPETPGHVAGSDPGTLEGTIDYASDRSGIGGSVDLSPEVRFTVQSERESYWRTGVYDRFGGDEWIRTGDRTEYDGPIAGPPGEYDRVEHLVTAETDLGVMPAAPQPLAVEGDLAHHTEVSAHGQFHPADRVREGDSYAVESAVVDPDPVVLRNAGTAYPEPITDRYLQTPEGVSSEFEARTGEIVADADTPYGKAVAIESYLRSSKEYSLEVDRPDGNVAEAFLLEMDEGYCVYFATAMTQMLRAEDVPARYVTGYTSGQEVDDGEYVVRGTDAHAWVEVYFPDHGWVAFEPTPGDSRDAVHDDAVQQAREDGDDDVDTDESEDASIDDGQIGGNETAPHDEPEGDDEHEDNESSDDGTESVGGDDPVDPDGEQESIDDDGFGWGDLLALVSIPRETAAVGLVALTGLLAVVHRTRATARLRRTVGLYWQRTGTDPDSDAVRAYRRLEALLAREHRPRDPSESAREYLEAIERDGEAIDPRAGTVVDRYERAIYGGGVDRAEATEAVDIVDDLARSRLPIVGHRRN